MNLTVPEQLLQRGDVPLGLSPVVRGCAVVRADNAKQMLAHALISSPTFAASTSASAVSGRSSPA